MSFYGSRNQDVADKSERITPQEFKEKYWTGNDVKSENTVIIDVRPSTHYKISNFQSDVVKNVPLNTLTSFKGDLSKLKEIVPKINEDSDVVVFCRYGNDSRLATRELKDKFGINNTKDVMGGFFAYIDQIDPSIPKY